MTDDGELKDYLVNIFENNKNDGSITLNQPRMVKRVLELFGHNSASKKVETRDTLACINELLDSDLDCKPRVKIYNYKAAVGWLSYNNSMVRPDTTMATQQCARFCN